MKTHNLPASRADASRKLTDAENAYWDHVEECTRCTQWAYYNSGHMCGIGQVLWRARSEAADTARNWDEYNKWINHGGYERYLANDWVAQ